VCSKGPGSCNCGKFKNSVLKAGCNNFKSLGWNNPTVTYKSVTCPPELVAAPPCGTSWPAKSPPKCSSGLGGGLL